MRAKNLRGLSVFTQRKEGILSLTFLVLFSILSFKGNAANRHWIASTASNWNNTANWSATAGGAGGASVPGSADVVYFDNVRIGNCIINANVNISRLIVNAGYTGTISQGTFTINIGSTATLSSGTFAGGSGNITVVGAFTLSGTNFTSTSGILTFNNNTGFTSGTFNHNNGTVRYSPTIATLTVSGTSRSFYGLEFVGLARTFAITSTGNTTVLNKLTFSGSQAYTLNTGTFDVKGDIVVTNTATGCGGSATINVNGTGTQNFTGSTTVGYGALPKLTVNKASGTLNLANTPGIANTFLYSAGTINAGTSTFFFARGSVASYAITGSVALNNVAVVASSALTLAISAGTAITVNGSFSESGAGSIIMNTGTVNIKGNVTLSNTGVTGGGSATFNINGTTNQSITASGLTVNQSRLPIIIINKSAGNLSLVGNLSFANSVTLTSGTVVPGTSTAYIVNSLTLTGSFNLYNVSISAAANVTLTVSAGSTVTTLNTLTMASGASNILINTGTLAVQGNIVNTNTGTGGGGTGTILINGSNTQSLSSTGVINQGRFPAVTINKTGGNALSITNLITVVGNWTYTAGTLTTTGSTVVFDNTMTITGTHTLNNIEFEGAGNYTFTIAAGTTVTANGSTKISGTGNVTLNTGNINLKGDLLLTNTATAGGGNTILTFNGTSNQNITSALAINQSRVPSVTINKTAGTLKFPSILTVRGNWVYSAGTLDVASNNSTVVFANTMSFTGSHALQNVTFDAGNNYTYTVNTGTLLTVNGTMTTSGALNVTINTPVSAANAIQLLGNMIINNTGTGGGTATILVAGTGAQSIAGNSAAGLGRLPNVRIQKTSGTLSLAGTISESRGWTYVSGTVDPTTSTVVFGGNNLTVASAGMSFNNISVVANTVTLGTDITLNGNASITAGILAAGARVINLKGNWNDYGTAGFIEGTGTVNFNGIAQNITCPGGENFNNLTIAGTGNKTLVNNVTIASTLTFTNGLIVTGANKVIMPAAGSIVGAGSGKYVFGSLQKNFALGSNVSRNFETGNTSSYLPVTIAFPTVSTAGDVTVSTTDGDHPQIGSSCFISNKSINRYWTLTNSGVAPAAYNATFNFLSSDVDPSALTNNVSVQVYNGSIWKNTTVNTRNPNSTQITGASTFGDVQIAESTSGSWTGATDSDWNNSGNWCGGVPLAATDVIINASVPNAAQVTLAGGLCNNLTISSGASLTILSGNTLNVKGNWTNNGTFVANGTVQFSGSATQSISGSAATTFNNMSVTNTTSPGVQVQSNQNLKGVLTLGSNAKFDADGSSNTSVFTLLSTADSPTQDAAIAALPAGAQVTGKVTVQRFMSIEGANSGRIYRYISSPVQNATVADLQNEIPVTGTFTGTSSCVGCGTNQSMFGYTESVITDLDKNGVLNLNDGYFDFPDASNTETFQTGRGYSVFVRGNKIPTALWDVTGVINSGNINYPVTFTSSGTLSEDGWNLIGNPYPSTIDWNASSGWTKTNVGTTIYVPDNGGVSSKYATWNGVTGTNGGSRYIATGQAFWVKAGSASPTLISTENVKSSGTQTTFFRRKSLSDIIRITLANSTQSDEAVIHFRDDATAQFDDNADAWKLLNTRLNLSTILSKGKKLAINSLATLSCNSDVKIAVDNVPAGNYSLSFSEFESFDPAYTITLHDNFKNALVDVRSTSNYSFDVTSDTTSYGSNRFQIEFSVAPVTEFSAMVNDVCNTTDQVVLITNAQIGKEYTAFIAGSQVSSSVVADDVTLSLVVPKENLTVGTTSLLIKVAASDNCNTGTKEVTTSFEVVGVNNITSTESGMHCQPGVVTLAAKSSTGVVSYNWYNAQKALIDNQHASTFTTAFLNQTETYFVASVNKLGCESSLNEVTAKIVKYNPAVIEVVGDTLISNYATGNQWLFNNVAIDGATNQMLVAHSAGDFTVNVTIEGCTTNATTSHVNSESNTISAYPNPIVDVVTVQTLDNVVIQNSSIINSNGQVLGSLSLSGDKKSGQFDFKNQPSGIYILRVVKDGISSEMKLLKD